MAGCAGDLRWPPELDAGGSFRSLTMRGDPIVLADNRRQHEHGNATDSNTTVRPPALNPLAAEAVAAHMRTLSQSVRVRLWSNRDAKESER